MIGWRLVFILFVIGGLLILTSSVLAAWASLHPRGRTYVCVQVSPNYWECR